MKTFDDFELSERSEFFLFPGTDQILLQFKLEKDHNGIPSFIHTDKLGNEIKENLFMTLSSLNFRLCRYDT